MAIAYNPYLARPQLDQWNLENGYSYAPGQSWDSLVNFAKQRQSQLGSSANIGDQWNPNSFNMGFGGRLAQVNLGDGGDWNGANFYTITQNTPSGHYMSRLYRNADGSIGEQFVRKNEGFPVEAALVLAAPFAAAAMGAGAAGAGAAGAAEAGAAAGAASSGAGAAAGAGAAGAGTAGAAGAGWVSAEMGAGYLGGLMDVGGLSGLGAAGAAGAAGGAGGAGGAGWTSGYDLAGGAALPSGSSGNALSGLLSQAGDKMASMGITDWINAAGTVANIWGSNKAAGAQVDASKAATAELARQYNQNRADMMPWMQAGRNALSQLTSGNFDITQDPSYKFRLDQGMKALENSAAARGGVLSGANLRGITDYSQGLASTEYGNAYNRLASLAGVGQTATQNIGNQGLQTSGAIANNTIGAGNARASGYVGSVNAINQGVGQWYNNNQTNRLMDIYAKQYGL